MQCAFCKNEISSLNGYNCKFCLKYFCSEHRLPERHKCWEAQMYRVFSEEMRKQDKGIIFGAKADAIMKEFRIWLEGKRKKV